MDLPCPPLVPLGTGDAYCGRCFAPREKDLVDEYINHCWACQSNFAELDGVSAITYHTHSFRSPKHRLGTWIYFAKKAPETKNIRAIGNVLYRFLGHHMAAIREQWGTTLATFVPSHPSKVEDRGFDLMQRVVDSHAELRDRHGIRSLLAQVDAAEQPDEHRRANPKAFSLAPGISVAGERVLVIDDVITSGSTMASVASVLRAGGATGVYGLGITRAVSGTAEQQILDDLGESPYDWSVCHLRSLL